MVFLSYHNCSTTHSAVFLTKGPPGPDGNNGPAGPVGLAVSRTESFHQIARNLVN